MSWFNLLDQGYDDRKNTNLHYALCATQNHDTNHLHQHLTTNTLDLWNNPVAVTGLLALWDDAVGTAG